MYVAYYSDATGETRQENKFSRNRVVGQSSCRSLQQSVERFGRTTALHAAAVSLVFQTLADRYDVTAKCVITPGVVFDYAFNLRCDTMCYNSTSFFGLQTYFPLRIPGTCFFYRPQLLLLPSSPK